jgi:hypothetical protein
MVASKTASQLLTGERVLKPSIEHELLFDVRAGPRSGRTGADVKCVEKPRTHLLLQKRKRKPLRPLEHHLSPVQLSDQVAANEGTFHGAWRVSQSVIPHVPSNDIVGRPTKSNFCFVRMVGRYSSSCGALRIARRVEHDVRARRDRHSRGVPRNRMP